MRSMLHEGESLKPSARTLWETQAFSQKPPVEVATNLYTYIRDKAAPLIEASKAARAVICDFGSLKAHQQSVRKAFLSCIGGLPGIPKQINAKVTSSSRHARFTVENTLIETRPGYYATSAIYRPSDTHKPCPAVLLLIGHTDLGKADAEYQYLAQLLCGAGFAVLALDPYGEGERFEHYETDIDLQPIQGCSGEHDLMDWKLKLLGVSLSRYFIADALAALKYLKSLPYVDESRVGLTGHSGGGTQVSMLMLAAGEEFACAAPCAYITDMKAMLDEGVDPDNEMLWPGSLKAGIDYADILLGMAPKPVTVLSNAHDFFPREGTLRACEEAKAVYERLGVKAMPNLVCAESEHAYGQTLAWEALSFFSRTLLDKEVKAEYRAAFRFELLKPGQLHAAGGNILKACPGMRTLHDEAIQLLNNTQPVYQSTMELKQAVSELIKTDAVHADEIRVYAEGICAPYAYRCLIWRSEEGIWLNGVLLRSMRLSDAPQPTALMLWPGGTARIAEHSGVIHKTVLSGRQALICDLPGEGALLPAKLGGSDMYISWSTMYKLNAYLIQLGDSLCALRTRGVLAACDALKNSGYAKQDDIELYCEDCMIQYGCLAALLNGVFLSVHGVSQDYEEIVSSSYHDQTHTHAWALPGALKCFKTSDIINALKQNAQITAMEASI